MLYCIALFGRWQAGSHLADLPRRPTHLPTYMNTRTSSVPLSPSTLIPTNFSIHSCFHFSPSSLFYPSDDPPSHGHRLRGRRHSHRPSRLSWLCSHPPCLLPPPPSSLFLVVFTFFFLPSSRRFSFAHSSSHTGNGHYHILPLCRCEYCCYWCYCCCDERGHGLRQGGGDTKKR